MSLLDCDRCKEKSGFSEHMVLAGNYKARLCDKCGNEYTLMAYDSPLYREYDNLFCTIEKIMRDPDTNYTDLGDALRDKCEVLKKLHKMSDDFVHFKT